MNFGLPAASQRTSMREMSRQPSARYASSATFSTRSTCARGRLGGTLYEISSAQFTLRFTSSEYTNWSRGTSSGSTSIAPITRALSPLPRSPTVNSSPAQNSSTKTGSR